VVGNAHSLSARQQRHGGLEVDNDDDDEDEKNDEENEEKQILDSSLRCGIE
jgi:hypothetical protein